MYLFELSKENIFLAKYEIESLLSIKLYKLNKYSNELYYSKEKVNKKLLKRLAYTKNVYNILKKTKNLIKNNYTKLIKNSYKIDLKNYSNKKQSIKELSDIIYRKIKNPIVSLKNPTHIYKIFIFDNQNIITEKIFKNTEDFKSRKSHLRKYNYPTSLNPKQARAMINLIAKKSFLDPFCGAGGILIEGALMGLNTEGSDISQKMVNISKEHLKLLNLNSKLSKKDATKLTNKYESIVTDLPFGKNSIITDKVEQLYLNFLLNSSKITKKIVIGHKSDINIKKIIKNTKWILKKQFSIYVHKSMTRQISVLFIM